MGDDAPNPVVLMIDTQDPYCRPGASGRPAALGVSTKAVDSAVQRHKHAVEIDHTDGAHIAVAHHILLQRLLIVSGLAAKAVLGRSPSMQTSARKKHMSRMGTAGICFNFSMQINSFLLIFT